MPVGSEGACEALLLLLWRRRRGALTALSPPLALLAPLPRWRPPSRARADRRRAVRAARRTMRRGWRSRRPRGAQRTGRPPRRQYRARCLRACCCLARTRTAVDTRAQTLAQRVALSDTCARLVLPRPCKEVVPFGEDDSGDEDGYGGASADQDADETFATIMSPTAGVDWRYWDGADRLEESRLKVRGSSRAGPRTRRRAAAAPRRVSAHAPSPSLRAPFTWPLRIAPTRTLTPVPLGSASTAASLATSHRTAPFRASSGRASSAASTATRGGPARTGSASAACSRAISAATVRIAARRRRRRARRPARAAGEGATPWSAARGATTTQRS